MLDAPTDPLIGRAFGQYEVVAKLGGGGMGVVYQARDTKLGRMVALKFLPPQWSHDDTAKQRFAREAQAASATSHRNICVIHDIDQTEDGQLFIVMPHYEGQTLKQKLDGGALPLGDALEIATEAAEGLAKAHGQGVVHRDIKPGNLMISDDGVKILDFGLAKFADTLQLTIPGSTIGTVAYMSPEQVRGEEADARSDIWALGVVLYEMLTGEVPFKGAYPEAIFYAVKTELVPPLGRAGRDIPEALEAIVLRALEKDRANRYQTARELARDLRLLQGRTIPIDLRTQPLPPVPPRRSFEGRPLRERLPRAARSVRAIAAMGIAAAVLLLAGSALYQWMTPAVARIPVAIAPVANHTGEPELDAYRLALTHALIAELSASPNIRVVPYLRLLEIVRRFIGAGEMSTSDAVQEVTLQGGSAVVVVPVLEYRNDTRVWLARAEFRSAETRTATSTYETEAVTSSLPKEAAYRLMLSLADGIQRHFVVNGPGRSYRARPAASRSRSIEGIRAFVDGLNEYEHQEYSAALVAFRRAASQDDQHAMTHAWVSRTLLVLKQSNEAVESARRAKQLVSVDTPEADRTLIDGLVAETQGDFRTAEQHYRRLASLEPVEPAASLELAEFLQRQTRSREAVDAHRAVLRLDPGYVRPHVDLCRLYWRLDERALAEQEAQHALEQYRRTRHRAGEAQALLCLGDLQRRQGGTQLVAARQNVEAARDIFESLGLRYGLSRVYQYLGAIAGDAGDYPAAVRFFEESLSRSRQVGNRDMEGLALMNAGVAYEWMGQAFQALQHYEQSRDVYEKNGDELRAAEQEINAASLQIDAGSDQIAALRRARNAHATLRKHNSVEFEIIAMQVEASSYLYSGRQAEARKQLLTALSLARDRHLNGRIVSLTVKLAESYFATSEYDTARVRLEEVAATDEGRDHPEVAIALGRVLVRLGDFDNARGRLVRALADIEASGRLLLAPVARLALGELEYESRNVKAAREHFDQAASYWVDLLPGAASIEAQCYRGMLESAQNAAAARGHVAKGVAQARKIGRPHLESQCRVHEARIQFNERRYADAVAVLKEIPMDGEQSVGLELRASVHHWRSRALSASGNAAQAESEGVLARKLARDLQASLPLLYRDRFESRPDIRAILEETPSQRP